MLAKFRKYYPQGSLVSKLVKIDRGTYIVKVSIKVENVTLATALAGGEKVETAEDAARERAIAALVLDSPTFVSSPPPKFQPQITPVNPSHHTLETSSTQNNSANSSTSTNEPKIVNFPKSETNLSPQPEAISPTVKPDPTEPTAPEPRDKPDLEAQNSDPEAQSGNLFAGTSAPTNNTALEQRSSPQNNDVHEKAAPEAEIEDFDFTQVKQKTDIEIKRLGWTRDDGREFLQSRYGKRSRLHLKDNELLEFLHYLEKLPTPVN